jgi:hypothetical protein
MKCWICGSDANSGEHKAKASDVRSVIGTPTNKIPFHLRIGDQKLSLQGIDVDLLKWGQKICANCNNSVSAPYDRSWEKLSSFLQKYPNGLPSINLKTIFGPEYIKQHLNFYLYFVKQFGCYIANANIGIDLKSFSESLVNGRANQNFYLRLSFFKNWPIQRMIALTPMSVATDSRGVCIAIAGYGIGAWCVDMVYWDPRVKAPPIIRDSYKPPISTPQMKIFQTEAEQNSD